MVVGRNLGESSRATRPLITMIKLRSFVVVVGVIETGAILKNRFCSQDGVVQHALHAVSVLAVSGDAHEITNDLEVPVRTANGFEARVGFLQTFSHIRTAGRAEGFVWPPPAGGEALRGADKVEAIFRGSPVHLTSVDHVSLNRGAQGVHMAVGMKAGEHVIPLR